jgi:hypothetical protein
MQDTMNPGARAAAGAEEIAIKFSKYPEHISFPRGINPRAQLSWQSLGVFAELLVQCAVAQRGAR